MATRHCIGRMALLSGLVLLVSIVSACGGTAGPSAAPAPVQSAQSKAVPPTQPSSAPSTAPAASTKAAPPQLGKLTIVISGHGIAHGGLYVAVDKGYFKTASSITWTR